MTLNTLILIILVFFLVVFAVGLSIVIFYLGRHTIKDNPRKAFVFRKTGRHISKPIKGDMVGKPIKRGCVFKYGENTVIVPYSYADIFFNQRRMIFINKKGQVIASPFTGDITLSDSEKDSLIYEVLEGHIGSDAMKAIKGKNNIPNIIIIVIAFILGALLVFGYNYISTTGMQIPTPAQTEEVTPELKIVPE